VKQESNIAGRFADIFAREGVRGLWRGAGPTTTRAAVVAGAQLSTYDHAKATLIREGLLDDNFLNYLVSSAFAALCACLVSNPFDVVRTRLMNQRRLAQVTSETHAPLPPSAAAAAAPGQLIYRSSVHCLMFTVRTERVTALYKGFLPSLSRMLLWNLIFFQLYEWLKKQNVEQARSNCSDER
jgi:solute carrier family 25 protein 14/30